MFNQIIAQMFSNIPEHGNDVMNTSNFSSQRSPTLAKQTPNLIMPWSVGKAALRVPLIRFQVYTYKLKSGETYRGCNWQTSIHIPDLYQDLQPHGRFELNQVVKRFHSITTL